jgi:hypothetical protein
MASELLRPGGAAGIEAILRDQFEVRTTSSIGVAALMLPTFTALFDGHRPEY